LTVDIMQIADLDSVARDRKVRRWP